MSTYVPKPDEEGINSPASSTPFRDLLILTAGFISLVAVLYGALASVSDWTVTRMSVETEMRWFGRLWKADRLDAKEGPHELNKLMNRLSPHMSFPVKVWLICSEEPNAYALPGGTVLLTRGLLESVQSENGLAFVLGHEIGHFINRDHLRSMGRQLVFATGAALLGIGSDDISGLAGLQKILARSYDRGQEAAADRFAIELSTKLYGHLGGADEFFISIQKRQSIMDKSVMRFIDTHPLTGNRLAAIRAGQKGETPELVKPSRPFTEWVRAMGCSPVKP